MVESEYYPSDLASLDENENMYTIKYDGNWDILNKSGGSLCWLNKGNLILTTRKRSRLSNSLALNQTSVFRP